MDQGLSTSPNSNIADLLYVYYIGNILDSQMKYMSRIEVKKELRWLQFYCLVKIMQRESQALGIYDSF